MKVVVPMHLSKFAAIIALSFGLTACGHAGITLPVISFHKDAPVTIPVVPPMALSGVKWQVYDLATLKTLVAGMEARGETNAVIYVLDQGNYEALAMNLSEMKRYITDQKAANDYLTAAIKTNGATPPSSVK